MAHLGLQHAINVIAVNPNPDTLAGLILVGRHAQHHRHFGSKRPGTRSFGSDSMRLIAVSVATTLPSIPP